jgi:hypothetical protein
VLIVVKKGSAHADRERVARVTEDLGLRAHANPEAERSVAEVGPSGALQDRDDRLAAVPGAPEA